MAYVSKKEKETDIDALKIKEEITSSKKKKEEKKDVKVKNNKKKSKNKKQDNKKSLWERFMTFCHGVVQEAKRVHWPSKKDMVKYSMATIAFIIFFSIFFYIINVVFAWILSLFN